MSRTSGENGYTPKPEHHFTFGLWTVGNQGRDPFGEPVRAPMAPAHIVRKLAEMGAYGVNLHDDDLIQRDATAAQRDAIVREFRQVLADTGMRVPMATTNLFTHPVFKDGAFTSNDRQVRRYALQKTMRSMDLGHELGAKAAPNGYTLLFSTGGGMVIASDQDSARAYAALLKVVYPATAEDAKKHDSMGFQDGWGTCADQLAEVAKSLA